MYIHDLYWRTAYRAMTAIFLLWGILLHFSCSDGNVTAHNISFFTVQSNLLCLVCLLLFLRRDIRMLHGKPCSAPRPTEQKFSSELSDDYDFDKKRPTESKKSFVLSGDHGFDKNTFLSESEHSDTEASSLVPTALIELKFTATLCIIVTFLGNHAVVLLSRTFTGGVLGLPMKSFLAHYVAPALVTLDWLLFTPKGRLRADSPLKWMLAPAFYLLFTALRALCCSKETLASTGKYPYFFLNVDLVGARIYIYIAIYFACFLMIGYFIFFTDLALNKISRRK